jgi:hypothetical protein
MPPGLRDTWRLGAGAQAEDMKDEATCERDDGVGPGNAMAGSERRSCWR